MSNRNVRNSRNRNFNNKKKKPKEVEFNVERKDINLQDIPHVLSKLGSNNDPQWYSRIPNLTRDAASIPFSTTVGLPFDLNNGSTPAYLSGAKLNTLGWTHYVPYALTLNVMPAYGVSNENTSAINVAAQEIYSRVQSKQSGAKNYDKTDLMMVIMAMDSAYMLYEVLLRAYRTAGTTNYMNRTFPQQILYDMGFDPAIMSDLANFKTELDLFAYKLGQVPIPDVFSVITRHSWLFSHVYKDNEDPKAQLYWFNPVALYVWTEGSGDDLTSLKCKSFTSFNSGNRISSALQVHNIISQIMDPILGSEDVGRISADLINFYGPEKMIHIAPVDTHEWLDPKYDQEVLTQIMNATIWPNTALTTQTISTWDITQSVSSLAKGPYLRQFPYLAPGNKQDVLSCMDRLLNFIDTDVNPDNVMVATRLCSQVQPTLINSTMPMMTMGTELIFGAFMHYYDNSGSSVVANNVEIDSVMFTNDNVETNGVWRQLAAFDWAPTVYNVNLDNTNKLYQYFALIQDVCNYTILTRKDMTQLNDVAVMSEFTAIN